MISCISNYDRAINVKQNNMPKRPAFGSLMLARIVGKSVNEQGDVFYTVFQNVEHGIFKSLAKNLNALSQKKGKQKEIFENIAKKLSAVAKDFKINRPFVRTTNIRVRSHNKKFILTGPEARMIDDLGKDCVAVRGDRVAYREMVANQIYANMRNRIYNEDKAELGVDIIVDMKTKKILDVDILPITELYKPKMTEYKPKVIVPKKPTPEQQQIVDTLKEDKQGTFAFFDDLRNYVRYGIRD